MKPLTLAAVPLIVAALAACSSGTKAGITAYVGCQNMIEAQLKSPGTADFPAQSQALKSSEGNNFIYQSYVDSQNSFGGVVRTNYTCEASETGDSYTVNFLVMDGTVVVDKRAK